jgi:Na+:H+ antiporter, NhaA family
MKGSTIFKDFFESERAGGLILICCTLISLLVSNSFIGNLYAGFWEQEISGSSLTHWINDGLMAIFFLLIGLELEREIYAGELSSLKKALLPIIAAIGGMVVPAAIFAYFNYGTDTQAGVGIPMATDIAFAIGILSLLGNRVSLSLKVLLTAIAVIDDLGAIIVIAIFYTETLSWLYLSMALGIFALLLVFNRLKIHNLFPYLFGGVVMWYFMLHSGVHATITGVLLAFAIPFGNGKENTASYKLQKALHKPVTFVVLPLFALANTCIIINDNWYLGLKELSSIGILSGLVVGKPFGIFFFSLLAITFGLCSLPKDLKWNQVFGIGLLSGIGFTMSIFIALLAYKQPEQIIQSKMAILIASLIAGTVGYIWLNAILKSPENH